MAELVILSPHIDDAIFSCWHLLTKSNATVVNVFSGIPPQGTHRIWDLLSGDFNSYRMSQKRIAENEAALKVESVKSRQIYLDFLDSQYRKSDLSAEEIAKKILATVPAKTKFLAPSNSAFFHHPDHVLVRQAGQWLKKHGHDVDFFPDAPYVSLPFNQNKIEKTHRQAEKVLGMKLKPVIYELSSEQLAAKRRVMKAYKSQYTLVNLNSVGRLSRVIRRNYEVVFEPR